MLRFPFVDVVLRDERCKPVSVFHRWAYSLAVPSVRWNPSPSGRRTRKFRTDTCLFVENLLDCGVPRWMRVLFTFDNYIGSRVQSRRVYDS